MNKKEKTEKRAIIILVDPNPRRVLYEDFIKTALKMLKEFGYTNLTLEEVREQVEKILAGDDDLNVIGMILEDYITNDQSGA